MKKDLQLAFHWFTHPNNTPRSYLTAEGMQIVEEIKSALSSHDLSLARQITNSLYSDALRDRREVGEILIHGGIFGFLLGGNENYHFAKDQFRNLVNTYFGQDLHYWAISLWLLGFSYWHLPEYKRDATQQWEYSLRILTDLSYSQKSLNPDWYQKIRFQVLEAFFLSRMFDQYFPVSQVKYLKLRPTLQPIETERLDKNPKYFTKKLVTRSLPIYQYIPAGGWLSINSELTSRVKLEGIYYSPIEDDISQYNKPIISEEENIFVATAGKFKALRDEIRGTITLFLETGTIEIDGMPYIAQDLRGVGQIKIREGVDYVIIRVKGTSMNLLDIQDGDYVLIQRQEDANHNDIVLAERIGIDTEATLKKFYKQGKIIELHPVSNDPKNVVLPVDKNDSLRILGIATAVLKPQDPIVNANNFSTNSYIPLESTSPLEIDYSGEVLDVESLGIFHIHIQNIIDKVVYKLILDAGLIQPIQKLLSATNNQETNISKRIVKAEIKQIHIGSFREQIFFSIAAILASNPSIVSILQNLGSDVIWAISESGIKGIRNKIFPTKNIRKDIVESDPANIGKNLQKIIETAIINNSHRRVEIKFRSTSIGNKEETEVTVVIDS